MSVSIIITESQKVMIISESFGKNFEDTLTRNYELVKKVLNESKEQIGINLGFLLSWGATIGGLIGPIHDFVLSKNPDLTEVEISLILTGVISTYYLDNKSKLEKIYEVITEKKLDKIFEKTLKKSDELRDTFIDFMGSLNLTFHKFTNIMSYTFIIPILPQLYEMVSQGGIDHKNVPEITKRILGFSLITVSGIMLKELVSKILKRFKG